MRFLFHSLGVPHLLHKTVSATVYHSPVEIVTPPAKPSHYESHSINALGIIRSELVVVIGAGDRDRASQIAFERLGRVEACEVVTQPSVLVPGCRVRPGDVILYEDSIA